MFNKYKKIKEFTNVLHANYRYLAVKMKHNYFFKAWTVDKKTTFVRGLARICCNV